MNFPVLVLRAGRDKSVRERHPWIFSGAVARMDGKIAPGDVVAIHAHDESVLGYGFAHPEDGLVCRVFQVGSAAPVFDRDYWLARFAAAHAYRRALPGFQADSFRLVNAEGDGLPGLVVDVFGTSAVVQERAPLPSTVLESLVQFLKDTLRIENVYDRSGDARQGEKRNQVLLGESRRLEFRENDFVYAVEPEHAQKTGHFMDQRENRLVLERFARDRRVLDTFCYTGAFSLHALRGGARVVLSMDTSARALEECSANVLRNFPAEIAARHAVERADVPRRLGDLPENEYDLIILDPPGFAKSRRAVDQAARGYKDINLRALRKIQSGGILFTFSCSQFVPRDLFTQIVYSAARDAQRDVRVVGELHAAPDHPRSLFHLEGEYLKGLILYVA